MRTRLDMDAPYIVHPHARAIHYQPFPAEALRALHIIRTLMVHTTDFAEVEWLEAREAMLIESCAGIARPAMRCDTDAGDMGRRMFQERRNRDRPDALD